MRTLLVLAALVAAMSVPWNAVVPPHESQAAAPVVEEDGAARPSRLPGARLSAALGIVPLAAEPAESAPERDADDAGRQRLDALFGLMNQMRRSAPSSGANPPAGVRCENGVCVLVDPADAEAGTAASPDAGSLDGASGPHREAADDAAAQRDTSDVELRSSRAPVLTWEAARQQLRQLGATHLCLESDGNSDGFRFSCSVPAGGRSAPRWFQAVAAGDVEAVARVIDQIAAWRQAQR